MGRVKFHCAYCDRAFEDSQDARKRHFQGRNHRANVKLWYDSFADREKKRAAARQAAGSSSEWRLASVDGQTSQHRLPSTHLCDFAGAEPLPPSMFPAAPDAFHHPHRLAEWG